MNLTSPLIELNFVLQAFIKNIQLVILNKYLLHGTSSNVYTANVAKIIVIRALRSKKCMSDANRN